MFAFKGFCHRGLGSCFGSAAGVAGLMKTLQQRKVDAPEGSYTKRLYTDSHLLASKLVEEAIELGDVSFIDFLILILHVCYTCGIEYMWHTHAYIYNG